MTEASTSFAIESDGLTVEPAAGSPLALKFSGSADTRSQAAIEELLGKVHDAATERHANEVTVDFRSLKFISSSCLKAFVVWLSRVQALEAEQQYRIRFFADDSKPWQKRSLGAIACFAVDLVKIETGVPGV